MKARLSLGFRLCLALMLGATLIPSPLHGQRSTNTVVGTVTDPTGGVVPAAEVAAQNQLTGVRYLPVKTDANGYFVITELPEGQYALQVVKEGFTSLERSGIRVSINETVKVDMQLQVGVTQQKITVTGRAALINTENPQLSIHETAQEISDLPVGFGGWGRSVLDLMQLGGGISSSGQQWAGNECNYSMAGSPPNTQTVSLDGANILQGYGQWYYNQPHPEEVESIKTELTGYGAEYGGIGAINMSSKAGTNKFHGTGQFTFTNNSLDARNTFASGVGKGNRRQWGGNIGGPILKNKMFFDFTGLRLHAQSPDTKISTVPTAKMLSGDFSEYPYQLYDPATTCGFFGNAACAVDASGNAIVTRTAFANNKIPSDRISSVSSILASYWPTPNRSGLTNNYTNEGTSVWQSTAQQQNYSPRIDLNLGERNRIFGKFLWERNNGYGAKDWPGNSSPTMGNPTNQGGWLLTLGDTHSFNATVVNEFRLSINRTSQFELNSGGGGHGRGDVGIVSKAGIQNISDRDWPILTMGGYASAALGMCCAAYDGFGWLVNEASDNVSIVRGRHTIKVGGGYRWEQNNWQYAHSPSGSFDYSGIFTKGLTTSDPGMGIADFMLGWADSAYVSPNDRDDGVRGKSLFAFAQDDIKVTPKLTVNIGVREETQWSPSEVWNRASNFSPTEINAATGTAGAMVFAGRNGTPTRFASATNIFLPRLGAAYSFNPKTVVRASIGQYAATTPMVEWTGFMDGYGSAGFSATPYSASTTDSATPAYTFCTENCITTTQLKSAVPITMPALTNDMENGQEVNYIPSHVKAPNQYSWTVSVQRELPKDIFLEAAYIGSRGVDLWWVRDMNQVPLDLVGSGNAQSRRPYPQYQGIRQVATDGTSRYNSLMLTVRRRMANGLHVVANYTWSHTLDDSSMQADGSYSNVQDIYNRRAEYGTSWLDHTHIFNAQILYEVKPFIPGTVGRAITGGWQVNNILKVGSGAAINMGTSVDESGKLSNSLRPNRSCSGKLSNPTIQEWFDPSCFSLPAPYTVGNSARYPLHGPGWVRWDFSLFKNNYFHTKLNERTNLQFRAEAGNVLNHVNYDMPNTTIGSASAGVINSAEGGRGIDFCLQFIF